MSHKLPAAVANNVSDASREIVLNTLMLLIIYVNFLQTIKSLICEQWRPYTDAAFGNVWSGSTVHCLPTVCLLSWATRHILGVQTKKNVGWLILPKRIQTGAYQLIWLHFVFGFKIHLSNSNNVDHYQKRLTRGVRSVSTLSQRCYAM